MTAPRTLYDKIWDDHVVDVGRWLERRHLVLERDQVRRRHAAG